MSGQEGGLSGYVSNAIAARDRLLAQQAEERAVAQTQESLAAQARLDQYIQMTTPLRNRLLKLAAPIDALLERFGVRELFEEVKDKYWKDGKVETLRPRVYRQIVLNPPDPAVQEVYLPDVRREYLNPYSLSSPRNYFYDENSDGTSVEISHLVNHYDLQDLIFSLIRPKSRYRPDDQQYGFVLKRTYPIQEDEYVEKMIHPGSASRLVGADYSGGRPATYHYVRTGRKVTVAAGREMRVEAIWGALPGKPDLLFSTSGFNDSYNYDESKAIRIRSYESPNLLKQLVANEIAAEM